MSDEMSVFKKMKEKITDEVNSASNRLQNMQIMDQIATSIGQQMPKNEALPKQTLPELSNQTDTPTQCHFSLAYDNSTCHEEEELNSEISPQHQLFNEQTIRRLKSSSSQVNQSAKDPTARAPRTNHSHDDEEVHQSVIDFGHLSSDIDEDVSDVLIGDDVEIDLLSEKVVPPVDTAATTHNHIDAYKSKYRNLVHALRKLNHEHLSERSKLMSQTSELRDQIIALDRELNVIKQQHQSYNETSLDIERKSNSSSPHQSSHKQNSKIKDLEKLMAKCKESLKAKNMQLKILKDSLCQVDQFKDYIEEIKSELRELKNAHETWTLSIAENKRVMHQEVEDKNAEMDKLKQKINDLQSQLKESNNRIMHLKTNIINLESRVVSTSAAHHQERENLTKQLTASKNNAIKQLQKEHELQTERVRLDLEKTIESLKAEILTKDELIIRSAEKQNELQRQNCSITTDLENIKSTCSDHQREISTLRSRDEEHLKEITQLADQIENLKSQKSTNSDLEKRNCELEHSKQEMRQRVEALSDQVAQLEGSNHELLRKIDAIEAEKPDTPGSCAQCQDYQDQLRKNAERYEQSLFELNTKLDLMSTANSDQEKALKEMHSERESTVEIIKNLRSECDELIKKNSALQQLMQDNESEMQTQQDQIDQLKATRQQLDSLKKENASLNSTLNQLRSELNERSIDLAQSREVVDNLKVRLAGIELAYKNSAADLDGVKREKDSLIKNLEQDSRKRKEAEQQLVVNLLAALKNLETPDTSPGSEKTYKSPDRNDSGDISQEQTLPDPMKLTEDLSSLALDRSNAYLTSNQRLQAVILDNTMISEEVSRLRDELNALSQEKSREVMSSLEEVDRLRTENQALIHDQKAYDDRISLLESEIESLRQKLVELTGVESSLAEASTSTSDIGRSPQELEAQLESRNREIEDLKRIMADKEDEKRCLQMVESTSVPNSTEFEYLKNIVYQFLMGREPVTLARVISAIFKFDQEQIDQICKVQEVIHQVSG